MKSHDQQLWMPMCSYSYGTFVPQSTTSVRKHQGVLVCTPAFSMHMALCFLLIILKFPTFHLYIDKAAQLQELWTFRNYSFQMPRLLFVAVQQRSPGERLESSLCSSVLQSHPDGFNHVAVGEELLIQELSILIASCCCVLIWFQVFLHQLMLLSKQQL